MSANPDAFGIDEQEATHVDRHEEVTVDTEDSFSEAETAVHADGEISTDDMGFDPNFDGGAERQEPANTDDPAEGAEKPGEEAADAKGGEGEPGDAADKDSDDDKFEPIKGRFLPDGRYEITDANGKRQVLDAEKMAPGKLRSRAWYEALEQRATAAEQRAQQLENERAKEVAELKAQFEQRETEQRVEAKPWTAKGAEQPSIDNFDSVEAWSVANHEWLQAQNAPEAAPEAPAAEPAKQTADPAQDESVKQFQPRITEMVKVGKEKFGDEFVKNCIDPDVTPFDTYMLSFLDVEFNDTSVDLLNHYGKNMDAAWQVRELLRAGNTAQAIREVAKHEVAAMTATPNSSAPGNAAGARQNDSGIETEADEAVDPELLNQEHRVSKAPDPIKPASGRAPIRVDPEKESPAEYNRRRLKETMADF